MRATANISTEFLANIAGADESIALGAAALQIARSEYPDLDIPRYLRRLDRMASVVTKRLPPEPELADIINGLNGYLFGELGFEGNMDDYFDPRNSFLNEVMERRLGIPITLSVIYMEVAQRVGLPLCGVSFPGHFLVKLSVDGGDIVLDPFVGGVSLSKDDLEFRLSGVYEIDDDLDDTLAALLAPARKRDIIVRMLHNLKSIYLRNGDLRRALNVVQHIVVLRPRHAPEIRDRGLLYQELECFSSAREDFRRYLELSPTADDVEEFRGRFIEMEHASRRLN